MARIGTAQDIGIGGVLFSIAVLGWLFEDSTVSKCRWPRRERSDKPSRSNDRTSSPLEVVEPGLSWRSFTGTVVEPGND